MYGKFWIPFHPLLIGPLGFLPFQSSQDLSISSLFIYATYVTLRHVVDVHRIQCLHSLYFLIFRLVPGRYYCLFVDLECTMYVDFRFHRGLFPRLGDLPIYALC